MTDHYRFPTAEEKLLKGDLTGRKISIFWDGDNLYYPGVVSGYNEKNGHYLVTYDENDSDEPYDEDLKNSKWKIWNGSDEDYAQHVAMKVSVNMQSETRILVYSTCTLYF